MDAASRNILEELLLHRRGPRGRPPLRREQQEEERSELFDTGNPYLPETPKAGSTGAPPGPEPQDPPSFVDEDLPEIPAERPGMTDAELRDKVLNEPGMLAPPKTTPRTPQGQEAEEVIQARQREQEQARAELFETENPYPAPAPAPTVAPAKPTGPKPEAEEQEDPTLAAIESARTRARWGAALRGLLGVVGATQGVDTGAQGFDGSRFAQQLANRRRQMEQNERAQVSSKQSEARRISQDERQARLDEGREADRSSARELRAARLRTLLESREQTTEDRARLERLRDPSSPESQRSQSMLRAEIRGYLEENPDAQSTLAPMLAQLDDMPASEERSFRSGLSGIVRPYQHRRSRRRGSRGGASAPGQRARRSGSRGGRRAQAQGGQPQEQAPGSARMYTRRIQNAPQLNDSQREDLLRVAGELESTRGNSASARGRRRELRGILDEATQPASGHTYTILPGVQSTIQIQEGEARDIRSGTAQLQGALTSMQRIIDNISEGGAWGNLTPGEMQSRARAAMVPLRAMVARVQGTGVINAGELELIDAALPNPNSISAHAFGGFLASAREWENIIRDRVRNRLSSVGVEQDGIRAAMGRLHHIRDNSPEARAEREREESREQETAQPEAQAVPAPRPGTVHQQLLDQGRTVEPAGTDAQGNPLVRISGTRGPVPASVLERPAGGGGE